MGANIARRLRRAGYRLLNEPRAIAWTEAPDSFRAFFRQRFRWTFGTLQCLWKQRGALFTCGWFGWLALPTLWLFQVLFQILSPLVDLGIVVAFAAAGLALTGGSGENGSSSAIPFCKSADSNRPSRAATGAMQLTCDEVPLRRTLIK